VPARQEQADLLYRKWLLDVPKLLDIAALYALDNLEMTQQLMIKVRSSMASHKRPQIVHKLSLSSALFDQHNVLRLAGIQPPANVRQ
jgi:uncharacterized protein YaaW (UPF0174 family)